MPIPKERDAIQSWAANQLLEYSYRKMFHLSKAEMLAEPMEDIALNMKIREYYLMKDEKEDAIVKMKEKYK